MWHESLLISDVTGSVYFWLNHLHRSKYSADASLKLLVSYLQPAQLSCGFISYRICDCATNYDSMTLMINAKPGTLKCHVVTVYEIKSLHLLCLPWWHLNVLWAQLTATYLAIKYTYSSIIREWGLRPSLLMLVMDGAQCLWCVMHHFVITHLFVPRWHCPICQFSIPDESVDVYKNALVSQPWHYLACLSEQWPKPMATAMVDMDHLPRTALRTTERAPTRGWAIRLVPTSVPF